jgi:hypothetical protein
MGIWLKSICNSTSKKQEPPRYGVAVLKLFFGTTRLVLEGWI